MEKQSAPAIYKVSFVISRVAHCSDALLLPGPHYSKETGVQNLRIKRVYSAVITPPEATNTGPGFNRGSGGGARGCGFEERVGEYVRTEGGHFL